MTIDSGDHVSRLGRHPCRAQRRAGRRIGGLALQDALDDNLTLVVAAQVSTQPSHPVLSLSARWQDVGVRGVEFGVRLPQHVDEIVVRGNPLHQRPVAGAHRCPVDAVHILTPVVVPHQAGVLVEHLQPLIAAGLLAAQPGQVHGNTIVFIGFRAGGLHPQIVTTAHDQLFAVAADSRIIAGVDHNGQLALLDVVGLNTVFHLLAGDASCAEHPGVRGKTPPHHSLRDGGKAVVASCGNRQRDHPVLDTVDIQDDVLSISGLLVWFSVFLVRLLGLAVADRPAINGGAERYGVLRAQRNHIGPHRVGEPQIKVDLVVGGVDGPARQEIQIPAVQAEGG